jgi:hypothetical protein
MESDFFRDKKLSRRTLLAQGYRIDARCIGRGRRSALDDVRGLGRPDLCGQKRLCLRRRRSKHNTKRKCCEHSRPTTRHKPNRVLKHAMLTQETSAKTGRKRISPQNKTPRLRAAGALRSDREGRGLSDEVILCALATSVGLEKLRRLAKGSTQRPARSPRELTLIAPAGPTLPVERARYGYPRDR